MFRMFVIFVTPSLTMATEIDFFGSKIDYWAESKSTLQSNSISRSKENISEKSVSEFPWKTYLDPKNKEFFKEGEYTPPEPFMEIARNPTDENIKNWFEFMKRKNELAQRLDLRMREYLANNGNPTIKPTHQEKSRIISHEFDQTRFKIRMYFESTCPHCKRMFLVLRQLQENGISIETLQIDTGLVPKESEGLLVGKATSEEVKKHGVSGVPFLLIADNKRKILLPPVQGYHDYKDVMVLLRAASNK